MKYIQGNLLKAFENGEIDAILHQCNCTVGFGGGFARLLGDKYPKAENWDIEYRDFHKKFLHEILGTGSIVHLNKGFIINIYSQFYPGKPKDLWFDTFEQRIHYLKKLLGNLDDSFHYGIPLIASGLAACISRKQGLTDLEYFQKYIEPVIPQDMDITVYYL